MIAVAVCWHQTTDAIHTTYGGGALSELPVNDWSESGGRRFGFHIRKVTCRDYGFVIIKVFNRLRVAAASSPVDFATSASCRYDSPLMGETSGHLQRCDNDAVPIQVRFAEEERYVNGVLTLASRSLRGIMTPRSEISWLILISGVDEICDSCSSPHSLFRYVAVDWMMLINRTY